MQKFDHLKAIAAPLDIMNVDTDMIIPKQFLKTIKRTGLGVNLFDEMRYKIDGSEIKDFVLNNEPYRKAQILVSGDNFGCGSSREHAPWALLDFGIRAIIAPSFADIFYNNCFKNGILPIALPKEQVDILMKQAKNTDNPYIEVSLSDQTVSAVATNHSFHFDINSFYKSCLINGLDDIGLTLEKTTKIDQFESSNKVGLPWLHKETNCN